MVLNETRGYLNQLLGLEWTTFEQMTGRVLAEHYCDRNNRALGNQMKKKKICEKENPKLSPGFAYVQLSLPFAQPGDKFSLVFLQLYWEGMGGNCFNSLCHTFEECKNRITRFCFFCFFCHSFKNLQSFLTPTENVCQKFFFLADDFTSFLFFSYPSLRLLSFYRFCLKLQSSRNSCSLSDALTPSYSITSSASSSLVFPCPSSFIEP